MSDEKSRPATSATVLAASGRSPAASRGTRVVTSYGQRPLFHDRARREAMPCRADATMRASHVKGLAEGSTGWGARLSRVAIKKMETRPAKGGPVRSEATTEKGKGPADSEVCSRPTDEDSAQVLSQITITAKVRSLGRTQTAHPQTEGARSMRRG